jgi:hypothetical protein
VFSDVTNTPNPSIASAAFKSDFAYAMIKISDIEPLTCSTEQIRRICNAVNKLKKLFLKHLGVLYVVMTFFWFVIFGSLIFIFLLKLLQL